MSRVTNSVSKLSRSIGSNASTGRPVLEGHGLAPAYAELLRSHRRHQWDTQQHRPTSRKPFVTKPLSEPTPNPIVFPTPRAPSAEERHTPVPLVSRPRGVVAGVWDPQGATEPWGSPPPQIVYMSGDNPNNESPSLKDIESIDVDEARLKSA